METTDKITKVNVGATIQAPIQNVWKCWTDPAHIRQWNNASEDWHTPQAENDLRAGGKFLFRMEAKDGSNGFDFTGTYTTIREHEQIAYTLDDGRKVHVQFTPEGDATRIDQTFEAENTFPVEMQRAGWQAILDNFKSHAEAAAGLETLHFEVLIRAKPEKVYRTMIDEKQYPTWTAAFDPTSRFEGSWEKGAKIYFLGQDTNGNTGGMVSRIREHIPHKFISIEHQGFLQNGEEITTGPEVAGWAGAMENYTFTETDGKTTLTVDVDTNADHKAYFTEQWPKALQTLQTICEA